MNRTLEFGEGMPLPAPLNTKLAMVVKKPARWKRHGPAPYALVPAEEVIFEVDPLETFQEFINRAWRSLIGSGSQLETMKAELRFIVGKRA